MMKRLFARLFWCLWVALPLFAQAGAYDDFLQAIRLDDSPRLERLLGKGLDPNTLTEEGLPALIAAIHHNSEGVVALLLRTPNLDVNIRDQKGDTPLMLAAAKNKPEWVNALLRRGAEHTHPGRWNPLHYAASAGAVTVLQQLLQAGADINVHSDNNTTPLMMAARAGRETAARFLIEHGAEVLLVNDAGFDAQVYADRSKSADLSQYIARLKQALPRE